MEKAWQLPLLGYHFVSQLYIHTSLPCFVILKLDSNISPLPAGWTLNFVNRGHCSHPARQQGQGDTSLECSSAAIFLFIVEAQQPTCVSTSCLLSSCSLHQWRIPPTHVIRQEWAASTVWFQPANSPVTMGSFYRSAPALPLSYFFAQR